MSLIDRIAARFGYEAKSDPTAPMVVQMLGGGPVYNKGNYSGAAKYGYGSNVYVHRGIKLVAESIAGIPWKVRRAGSQGHGAAIEDHPLARLLNQPNDDMGGAFFREWLVSYLLLSGNAFVTCTRSGGRGDDAGRPLELWLLRPDRMKINPGGDSRVGSYTFENGVGTGQTFKKEDVLHAKFFNPLDEWYGMSPVIVASRVIDQHNAANDANTALLQNFMRSPGALVAKGLLTPEDLDGLKKEVREKWTGPKNSGKPLVLHGDLSWQPMGNTPMEMDWRAGKEAAAIEILIALGIPPELCGIASQKTYSNVQEARVGLMEETALPLADRLIDQFNIWLPPAYAKAYENGYGKARPGDRSGAVEIYYDRDDIELLAENAASKRTFVLSAFNAGLLTVNEAREGVGYDSITGEMGGKRYMPSGMAEVLSAEEAAKKQAMFGIPPAGQKPGQPGEKPGEKPGETPAGKPGEKPAAKPGEKPAAPDAEKAAEQAMVDAFLSHPDLLGRLLMEAKLDALDSVLPPPPPKVYPWEVPWDDAAYAEKYSPSQARDSWGRWVSAGGVGFLNSPGTIGFYKLSDQKRALQTLKDAGLTPEAMTANVATLLDEAKASGVYDQALHWYDEAHASCDTIADHFDVDHDTMYAMVAALSPRAPWDTGGGQGQGSDYRRNNLEDAAIILHTLRTNPSITVNQSLLDAATAYFGKGAKGNRVPGHDYTDLLGKRLAAQDMPDWLLATAVKVRGGFSGKGGTSLPVMVEKAVRLARGGSVEDNVAGCKVTSFYNNLKNPSVNGPVTIDTWMAKAIAGKDFASEEKLGTVFGSGYSLHATDTGKIDPKTFTYPVFASVVARVAADNGINADQAQAIVWTQYRKDNGL